MFHLCDAAGQPTQCSSVRGATLVATWFLGLQELHGFLTDSAGQSFGNGLFSESSWASGNMWVVLSAANDVISDT